MTRGRYHADLLKTAAAKQPYRLCSFAFFFLISSTEIEKKKKSYGGSQFDQAWRSHDCGAEANALHSDTRLGRSRADRHQIRVAFTILFAAAAGTQHVSGITPLI
jgi:hypothetical protein